MSPLSDAELYAALEACSNYTGLGFWRQGDQARACEVFRGELMRRQREAREQGRDFRIPPEPTARTVPAAEARGDA